MIPLGEYFQIQDDYLDCFGTPEQIGKIGTDIKDNKCSWVINQALLIATPEQRQLLDNNYGKKMMNQNKNVKIYLNNWVLKKFIMIMKNQLLLN